MKNSFMTKVAVALIGSTAFILIFNFLPVWITAGLATLVSVLGFYELSTAAKLVRHPLLKGIGFAVSAAIPWMVYFELEVCWLYLLLFLSLTVAFVCLVCTKQFKAVNDVARLLLCESVFPLSISLMTPLIRASAGVAIIIMAFITAWGTDAIAQLVGRKIGKTHFVPDISPNKSLEGSVAGIVGNALVIAVYALILKLMHYTVPVGALVLCGTLAGILGEIGDLFFSYIKRASGIKDFGSFIAGHGGVLDRFDSVLFVLPVWYVFIGNFVIEKQ